MSKKWGWRIIAEINSKKCPHADWHCGSIFCNKRYKWGCIEEDCPIKEGVNNE